MAEYYDPETYPKQWNYLQSGTIIDQYMIERALAHGGFSSVYLARQIKDQVQVAIKEYLPRRLAHRTWNNVVIPNNDENRSLFYRGRALFFEEAKVLATLKHPNIVNVINFFQANETVYMVMTYDYGLTLDTIFKDQCIKITDTLLLNVFLQLLTGLDVVHQYHILHLDIKPANILIRPEYDPLLLDFGAIQKYPYKPNAQRSKVLTKGYSPIEQYDLRGKLGPWSDIYAVGATMRSCLDAKSPPPATERLEKEVLPLASEAFKNKYPSQLLEAIDWSMAILPKDRPQSALELKEALSTIY
jgi:serine/threonine protein kinase